MLLGDLRRRALLLRRHQKQAIDPIGDLRERLDLRAEPLVDRVDPLGVERKIL